MATIAILQPKDFVKLKINGHLNGVSGNLTQLSQAVQIDFVPTMFVAEVITEQQLLKEVATLSKAKVNSFEEELASLNLGQPAKERKQFSLQPLSLANSALGLGSHFLVC